MTETLLIATHNRGKIEEIADLLADLEADLLGLDDVGIAWDVEETGVTFRENAILKAESYARASGLLTLADDSGLEVDALGGQPGVHTARFGGEGLNSRERYQLLLDKLQGIPWPERTARFRCVVAVAGPERVLAVQEGTVEGHIARSPSGAGGFGYDPVFHVRDHEATMAQLPAETKNRISHRARAILALLPQLQAIVQGDRS
ncbi:MAG TPA: XTP/dITP diphosphatase [Candidatus Sulfomarinibacteraceae bacterium]|nr:XTP/dITP diphosphatase [Candidatus Sulfomarinibacteraceae bacterium]